MNLDSIIDQVIEIATIDVPVWVGLLPIIIHIVYKALKSIWPILFGSSRQYYECLIKDKKEELSQFPCMNREKLEDELRQLQQEYLSVIKEENKFI